MSEAPDPTGASAHGVDARHHQAIGREIRIGGASLLLLLLGLTAWTAWAPVSGAVITSGTLRPVAPRVAVLAGIAGVVQRWPLVEGQAVHAGDVLAVLDDPDAAAQRDALADAEAGERARLARLRQLAGWTAQGRAAAPPALPAMAGVPASLHAEESRLLVSSWLQQGAAIDQLDQQLREATARVAALQRASAADAEALTLAADELRRNQQLAGDGFVSDTRLLALRRSVKEAESRLQGQRGMLGEALERQAELAGARRGEPHRVARDNARDLADAERRLRDLEARGRAAEGRWQKLTVTAPAAGRVIDLRPYGPGSVVGAGQALLDILPADGRLRVQAPLRPEHLAEVQVGANAEVRITAYPSRDTPLLAARVVLVGADRSTGPDPLGINGAPPRTPAEAQFVVWLELAPTTLPLAAGMEAEIFITTAARTPLDYWLSPLTRLLRQAGRER